MCEHDEHDGHGEQTRQRVADGARWHAQAAPERPQAPPAYPAVNDMPPARNTKVMTEEEKKRAEAELAVMRDQQARRAQSSAANPN